MAIWTDGVDAGNPSVLKEELNSIELDGEELLTQSSLPSKKKALESDTNEAIKNGIYCLPSIVYGDYIFRGIEQFAFFEKALAGEDIGNVDKWKKLKSRLALS